jgi:hypothetical protein
MRRLFIVALLVMWLLSAAPTLAQEPTRACSGALFLYSHRADSSFDVGTAEWFLPFQEKRLLMILEKSPGTHHGAIKGTIEWQEDVPEPAEPYTRQTRYCLRLLTSA